MLQVEKHPKPYCIGWIKATEKIQMKECCKVPFSFSKYRNEVNSDIVDKDVCHILFWKL